jgi:sec-independent protein translocase protein TatB
MLNIGAGEIALIMVVALLILGPKRLPELARGIGKVLRDFRRQTDEVRTTIETEFYRMDRELQEDPPVKPVPLPSDQPAVAPAAATEIGDSAAPSTGPNVVSGSAPTPEEPSPLVANTPQSEPTAAAPGKWEE